MNILPSNNYDVSSKEIKQFDEEGYVILRNVISPATVAMLSNYYWLLMRTKNQMTKDQHSFGKYGDLMNESLLIWLKPLFEKITGLTLYPTYSFMRLYHHNSSLDKHKDRVASEFAVSIAIDYDTQDIWPLKLISKKGKEVSAELDRGDLVFYLGRDLIHWRDTYTGTSSLQLFMFYVDANGPLKHLKFDRRKSLGDLPPSEVDDLIAKGEL